MGPVVVFDTETNGATFPDGRLDTSNQEIVQLAWIVSYPNGTETRKNHIIRGATHINYRVPHSITIEYTRTHGEEFAVAVDEFMSDVMAADVVIAHNISFDRIVIVNAMKLNNIPSLTFERKLRTHGFCNMYKHVNVCKILGRTGKNKKPTLSETYNYYYNEMPSGALHDALYDCEVTLMCYKEYKKTVVK